MSSKPELDSPFSIVWKATLRLGIGPRPAYQGVVSPRDEHELVIEVPDRVVDGRCCHQQHPLIGLAASNDLHEGAIALCPRVAEVVGLVNQDDVVLVLVALQLRVEPLPLDCRLLLLDVPQGWVAIPW